MNSKLSEYEGITHAVPHWFLVAWKRLACRRNVHAFDEVAGSADHYLSCDACGLIVNIASLDHSYVDSEPASSQPAAWLSWRTPAARRARR